MRILEVGIGLGFLAALGALVSIYPDPAHIYLKWLLFTVGSFIFLGCLILEIYERIKACRLKAFFNFLDKKIIEGQELFDSTDESECYWDGGSILHDYHVKEFEDRYKKFREQIYMGCEKVFGDKKELPFNQGQLPQLFDKFGHRDYRKHLKKDIQFLKDLRILINKEDVQKKLK
jgi:hypothetical protein